MFIRSWIDEIINSWLSRGWIDEMNVA